MILGARILANDSVILLISPETQINYNPATLQKEPEQLIDRSVLNSIKWVCNFQIDILQRAIFRTAEDFFINFSVVIRRPKQ
jgi:hypothetical protein